jgi:predicted transcriptional regulator
LTHQYRTITGIEVDLQQLLNSINQSPGSIETGLLMDEVCWEALAALQSTSDSAAAESAEQISAAAHQLFAEAQRQLERTQAVWLGWYAGQLRGVVALLQARRSQTARKPLPVTRRKHTIPVLIALLKGQANLTEVARQAGIADHSQASKVIDLLAKEGLVHPFKEGAHRLISLTALGRRALVAVLGDAASSLPGAIEAVEATSVAPANAAHSSLTEANIEDSGVSSSTFRSLEYGPNPPRATAWTSTSATARSG